MTPSGLDHPVALVAHARRVPSPDRERFAVAARAWSAARGGIVVETCHRVEAYAIVAADATTDPVALPAGGEILTGESAVRHAIAVAVGRDSVVVGEDQVLHQLREAVAAGRASGNVDPLVDRLLSVALRAGRRARSWRQGPPLSLADLAIAAIEARLGPLRDRRLLVVGAGRMASLAASSGIAAGATVAIANRTTPRAESLAARVGGSAVPFDPGATFVDGGGVIVALRGPWRTSAATERALAAGEAIVVDLSVPRAVGELVAADLDERFVSADDLARMDSAIGSPPSAAAVARLDGLVESATAEFATWFGRHAQRAAAEALADRAEDERLAELADLWRRLPRLDLESRDVIEGMSRHLAARLLREPLERLGRDPDGRHERAVRELFGL